MNGVTWQRVGRQASMLLACCGLMSACRSAPAPPAATDTQAPGAKQAIRALLAINDVPLTTNDSCRSVGSEFSDTTIGDYVAGLMADMVATSQSGRNTVAADCRAAAPRNWQCTVELGRRDGENEWVRGVEFRLADGRVAADSVRCTGGG
jgi:hypothetical protein